MSFVNQYFSTRHTLAVFDDVSGNAEWIFTPNLPWEQKGCTGLCSDGQNIYVCYQDAGLVTFDRHLGIKHIYSLQLAKEPHSVQYHGRALYVVSTGSNSIVRCDLGHDGDVIDERVYWTMPGATKTEGDVFHLNSLTFDGNGRAGATLFGRKTDGSWQNANQGCLIALDDVDEPIFSNLRNPHTAFASSAGLVFAESGAGRLIREDGVKVDLGGYVRGIAEHDGVLIAASNTRRKISHSLGKWQRTGSLEDGDNDLILHFLDPATLHVTQSRSIRALGLEIFDLLVVDAPDLPRYSMAEAAQSRILDVENYIADMHTRLTDEHARLQRELSQEKAVTRQCRQYIREIKNRECAFYAQIIRNRWKSLCMNGSAIATVALFGAGEYTRWLLKQVDDVPGPRIVSIIDDRPTDGCCIDGIPVVCPQHAPIDSIDAIILSTDSAFAKLSTRVAACYGSHVKTINLSADLPDGPYEKHEVNHARSRC